ncbi:MAG: hypothetical protein GX549_08330 [Clostridiales bacterium]|nr:hypothetical protein [Clostridiales bacterium]
MRKLIPALLAVLTVALYSGCAPRVTDPALAGQWDLIGGTGSERLVIAEDGGAFFDDEPAKWEITDTGTLEITDSARRKTTYRYSVEDAFLTLTAESGQDARYVHPDKYPGDAAQQERLAGLWTDEGGRLTLYFEADGDGTRYGWLEEADAGFTYTAADGRMRMTFQSGAAQWVQYAFAADGTLEVLFEHAPDGGQANRTLWKQADSGRIRGDYLVLYDNPPAEGGPGIRKISIDGQGGCTIDNVYGSYQLFENNVVIINARGTHLSLTTASPAEGFLTLGETGLDHEYAAVREDPALADPATLEPLAGIWSDADSSHMLQISPGITSRVVWDDFEGQVNLTVVGGFLRAEPVGETGDVFYLCFEKVGAVLYVEKSSAYPGGYESWIALEKLY